MTFAQYKSTPGLSHSGMKDLAVSPFRFWYWHVNPNRVERPPTAEMILGSALHCAILEPKEFDSRYAMIPDEDDFPGCLRTIEDLRAWIRSMGQVPSGTKKEPMIQQALTIDPNVLILDVEKAKAEQRNVGKTMVPKESWLCVAGAAQSLMEEPRIVKMLAEGEPEVPLFAEHEGVPIKGCLDWVAPNLILDLKTFSQREGKSIDKSITDAIFWNTYYQKAYLYSVLRGWPEWKGENVMAFVESSPPHEVRIRSFHPKTGGHANVYWTRALIEVRSMCRLYKECWEKFGEKPWRYAQEVNPLTDEEIPQLMY